MRESRTFNSRMAKRLAFLDKAFYGAADQFRRNE